MPDLKSIHSLLLSSPIALTLSDRRLYNYLLHSSLDKLNKQLNFVIPLSELHGVYGTGLPPADRLKESLRRLMRTLIEFEIPLKRWVVTSLLENAKLDEIKSKLYYSYPLHCRELFTNPFTLEKCLIQAHFTQKYSNLLYELLGNSHYAKQETLSVEIADLRSCLNIPDNKLTNFSDFDRFALMPALKEINSYAGFAVKYHTERKGMKVTHVVFEMQIKKNILSNENAKAILPAKRPRLFIDNPELESAYSYLLNAETSERRKFFDKAVKHSAKKKIKIDEDVFDRPDLWFKWVETDLLKSNK